MRVIAMFAAVILLALGPPARSAEVKCLFPLALKSAFADLIPTFEKMSGDTVTAEYGLIGAIMTRIQTGEAADVVILSDTQIADLRNQGKIVKSTGAGVTKLGLGVFIRRGFGRPDLASVDTFKRVLLSAKAIAYVDPTTEAPSGVHMAALINRLGLAGELNPRTKLTGPAGPLFDAVVNGSADMGFTFISEILAEPRVEFAGPLPPGAQSYVSPMPLDLSPPVSSGKRGRT